MSAVVLLVLGLTKQFAINTNMRSSDRLERLDMIKTVADQVVKLDKGHKVDLENPERTILVELYKVHILRDLLSLLTSSQEHCRARRGRGLRPVQKGMF